MSAPIPRILLALEGKKECIRVTNPFGGGDKSKLYDKDGKPTKERQEALQKLAAARAIQHNLNVAAKTEKKGRPKRAP